jgi:hypothetical protein
VKAVADRLGVSEQADEAFAKSSLCVSVHSEVPSPWTTISLPRRIRSIIVQPGS